MKTNNPLLDFKFLYELDHNRNRVTYARITSLTNDNYPIERIEGVVTAGSITLDGGSAVRRVCNLTLTSKNLNINNVYWSLSTRIKIEIGLENVLKTYYPKYADIVWFPQGVYILTDFRTQAQVNNYTITVAGKDKMCLLNGDISGVFNAETQLDTERVQQEDGTWVDEKRSIAYIIREMVHHYAQENFHNIIIKDIDTLSLQVLYNNATTFYYVTNILTGEVTDIMCDDSKVHIEANKKYYYFEYPTLSVDFKNILADFNFYKPVDEDDIGLIVNAPTWIIDEDKNKYYIQKIEKGQDLGYKLIETYYPDELIAGVGETVVSILDKIIKIFGAFEYFYNLDGQFVFQAKQTYVNTAWNNIIKIDNESYIEPAKISSQVKYSFEGSQLVSAYQNSPQLGNIKNDFTVWGKKRNSSGIEIPIHMRYAIDVKPTFYASYPTTETITTITGQQKTIGPYQDIYITKEHYKTIASLIPKREEPSYLIEKTTPPDYIYAAMVDSNEDPNACWWTVTDWGEYYKQIVGTYPTGAMQRFGNNGFTLKPIVFPNGFVLNASNILIIDVGPDGNIFLDPVEINGHQFRSWNGIMHGVHGCGHDYEEFVELHVRYGINSWIYKPVMPNGQSIIYNMPSEEGFRFNIVDWREIIYQMAKDYYLHNHDDDYEIQLHRNNMIPKFNINLFEHGRTGYEQYYHDIEGFWRLLYAPQEYVENYNEDNAKIPAYTLNKDDFYDIITDDNGVETYGAFIGPWNKNVTENPSGLLFWMDFFEAESLGLGQFSVPAIGDRPKNSTNDSIRALIYEDIPDLILIEKELYQQYEVEGKLLNGYNYFYLNDVLNQYIEDNKIRISTRSLTAQESIDDLLYNNAYCNETITITSVPIYYLEPNTIISARDEARMVHGYYIINKITLPLDYKGTMQITAIKVPERVY